MNEFFPVNLKTGHGEVIDSNGKRSKQTDLIVVDSTLQPFVKNYDNAPNVFLIEAVLCVGEVKAILNNLEDPVGKCNEFKLLSPKFSNGDVRCTNESDAKRFYHKRPFFVFAFESTIKIDNIILKLNELYTDKAVTEQIDAFFILDKGVIINFGDGNGALKYINPETKEPFKGFVCVSNESEVLQWFTTWVIAVIPKIYSFQNPIVHYLFSK